VIIDKLESFEIYKKINRRFSHAFDFILNYERSRMGEGKYEIDGSKVFALVQEYHTQSSDKFVWEAHRKYIDLQYMLEGTEDMGYAHISSMKPISDYIDTDDYILFKGDGMYIKVREGFFTIFFPHDCHKVRVSTGSISKVKKIVVKILV